MIKPPQQERSRKSLQKLLEAAREVISERGFGKSSISDITQRAGLTVGAFYQRFESKEAMLHALHEETVANDIKEMQERLDPDEWEGVTAQEILREIIENSLRISDRDSSFQKSCYQRALSDPTFAGREAEVRETMFNLAFPLVLSKLPNGRSVASRNRLKFCLMMIAAVVTDLDVASHIQMSNEPLSRKQISSELLRSTCLNLGLKI